MDRRTLLKIMGGIAALPALGKAIKGTGIKAIKAAGKVLPKVSGMPEWFSPLVNKIMKEDYNFSELPDKIKKFLRIISEYKKEYDKDTLADFLTYVWSKNCSDYVDIVSVLYPQIPRHGEKMYIDQSILLELPSEEEDFYMIKFLSEQITSTRDKST